MTTEGLDGRLPDENRRTQQQVRDSLLHDAIPNRDLAELQRLVRLLPSDTLKQEVLPILDLESREWVWRQATTEEEFSELIAAVHQGAFHILQDETEFRFGVDFSVAPNGDFPVLLVTKEVDEYFFDRLPIGRYSTLQLILRFVEEDET